MVGEDFTYKVVHDWHVLRRDLMHFLTLEKKKKERRRRRGGATK